MLNLADRGEKIVIRRRGKTSYLLTPVENSDFTVTPELEMKLEEGRVEYKAGNVKKCKTAEEAVQFLESL